LNLAPRSGHLRNTRLETFVFETSDLDRYVSLQAEFGVRFQSDIQDCNNYCFIQTEPSPWTGNSLGFIQWKGVKGVYSSPDSQPLDMEMDLSHFSKSIHLKNIRWLDHAATRVRAQDRNYAVLEFMRLTNYNFDFAIHVKSLNSITSVARLTHSDFAMVFTSGITPYVSPEASGPTEKFVQNYGPRVHHIAFQTEDIEETTGALGKDGMKFLLDLTGSQEEGLLQIFSEPSRNTLLVTEYIHRYGDFDGFFTESNVTRLTAATGKQ
jgi:4-hydroxyphenylpyruvate dioxygenase-like putative hemolysin